LGTDGSPSRPRTPGAGVRTVIFGGIFFENLNAPEFRRLVAGNDARPHRSSGGRRPQISLAEHVEHDDRDPVVHAERKCGGIHHFQPTTERIAVGDRFESVGTRVGAGIAVVDAVHFGGFEESVGADLARAESGGGVGGEKRMSGAGGEDDHAAFFKMAEGPSPDEGLRHVFHFDRGHHAGLDAGLFERVLESEGVDHRGEHTHVVGRVAVHSALAGGGGAAPDVAAADDDGELQRGRDDLFDLVGEMAGDAGREVVARLTERFTREF